MTKNDAKIFKKIQLRKIINKILMVLLMVGTDTLCFIISFLAAQQVRYEFGTAGRNMFPDYFPLEHYFKLWWLIVPLYFLFLAEGLYFKRRTYIMELKQILKALLQYAVVILALVTVFHMSHMVSRAVMLLTVFFCCLLIPMGRYFIKQTMYKLGIWKKKVLILGAAKTGALAARALTQDFFLGYDVAGFLDDDPEKQGTSVEEIPVLGRIRDLTNIIDKTTTIDLIIAIPSLSRKRLLEIVKNCENTADSIRIIPDMFGLATLGADMESLDDFMMISLNINLKKPWNTAIKRTFDIFLSLLTLLFGIPLILLISLAIRHESPGPAIFVQKRLGQNGTNGRFPCFKFRSMYINSNVKFQEYLQKDPEAKKEWEEFAKIKGEDPRVTKVGRWLRKTSLDELPQVFNVIRGEMSFIGPRPYLPKELEKMEGSEQTILVARPGITGLWQVSGRNDLSFQDRLRLDMHYVRNWSVWMDLIILYKTVSVVLNRKGAY